MQKKLLKFEIWTAMNSFMNRLNKQLIVIGSSKLFSISSNWYGGVLPIIFVYSWLNKLTFAGCIKDRLEYA